MQTLLQDLRYGLRMLLNKAGFSARAVIMLALDVDDRQERGRFS